MGERPLRSDDILARLQALHPRVIDLSLGRIEHLLRKMGHPEKALPPVVHVAGTNGKGSVVAFLRAILEAAGYRVHAYTSPHLVRFSERILVAGHEISDEMLSALLEDCEAVNDGASITFFEITTATAFLAFAWEPADICLLETGLGGRLDATNVVERPVATVLTPIGLDHQGFLGETLASIAFEKAGIFKPNVPCIVARQGREADEVIGERARHLGVRLIRESEDWRAEPSRDGMVFESGGRSLNLPRPRLAGDHQIQNAGLALAVAEQLPGFHIEDRAREVGLATVVWPARMERLGSGALTSLLPAGWELWLDGGHNPAAGDAVAAMLRTWQDRPTHLVFGMLRTKDAGGFLRRLAPWVDRVSTVSIPGEASTLAAEEAAEAAREAGKAAEPCANIAAAIACVSKDRGAPARVLICGSLYLVGEVLKENAAATEARSLTA